MCCIYVLYINCNICTSSFLCGLISWVYYIYITWPAKLFCGSVTQVLSRTQSIVYVLWVYTWSLCSLEWNVYLVACSPSLVWYAPALTCMSFSDRSNFLGTSFSVYDNGVNPSRRYARFNRSTIREELALVHYVGIVWCIILYALRCHLAYRN